jgi:histidyl-tRNA synthetase
MLVKEPAEEWPVIAVIPDVPEVNNEALKLVSDIRAGGTPAILGFRGNAKKRSETAKKAGAQAALFIRNTDDLNQKYHLMQLQPDPDREFLTQLWAKLPSYVRSIQGTRPA